MKNHARIFALMICVFWGVSSCIRDKNIPTLSSGEDNPDTLIVDKKPNIYLYPTQDERLEVKILFPCGGKIINSEPPYENGWNISVNPSGVINNEFGCLFYECELPNHFQTDEGWLIAKDNLEVFFKDNLRDFGFNDTEINDFIEFWIPTLNEYKYYWIFPQKADVINRLVKLEISKEPDSIQRLHYLFKGINTYEVRNLQTPQIPKFTRNGYTVTEWGGILAD